MSKWSLYAGNDVPYAIYIVSDLRSNERAMNRNAFKFECEMKWKHKL